MLSLWAGFELNEVTKHVETRLYNKWESGRCANIIGPCKIRYILRSM